MAGEPKAFEEFLLRVGRLNYSWTNTESLLIHFIAGLARCDKETAVIIFLTLNTSRARVDLVERLAKMPRVDDGEREQVLALTREMVRLAVLRNRYNHCIYAFDRENGSTRSIMMRISDRKHDIRVGESHDLDQNAMAEIEETILRIADLNSRFWSSARELGYPI